MFKKFGFAATLGLLLSGFQVSKADFVGTLIGGHIDIGVADEGGLLPHIHNHGEEELRIYDPTSIDGYRILTGEEFEPNQLWFGVSDAAKTQRPAGDSIWGFLGVGEGDDIWVLPATGEIPGSPYIGFSSEELQGGWSNVNVTIQSIVGKGGVGASTFSVFLMDDTQLNVISSASSTGTTDPLKTFTIPAGGHQHWFMAFTGEGVFDVELKFSANDPLNNPSASTAKFTFAVGNANFASVPEPTSIALLACCGTVLFGARKWRKKSKTT